MADPAGRRRFVWQVMAAALLAGPGRSLAQSPTGKVARIGFLGNSTPALEANLVGPFREGLRDLGYIEGRNLVIDYRWADGDYKRFPALVAELVALNVDLIVTAGTPAALAVKRTAPSLPLVMVAVGDPVGTGLVASLAHPGGNLTGLTSIAPDLEGKRLRAAHAGHPSLVERRRHLEPRQRLPRELREGGPRCGEVVARRRSARCACARPRTSTGRSNAITAERPDALVVLADRIYLHNRARIVDFTAATAGSPPCMRTGSSSRQAG